MSKLKSSSETLTWRSQGRVPGVPEPPVLAVTMAFISVGKSNGIPLFEFGGAKVQVTGYRSQVTGHRSKKMKHLEVMY